MARRRFCQKTNERIWVFFAFLLFTAKKPNSFVPFLGESTARKSAYGFIWPLLRNTKTSIYNFFANFRLFGKTENWKEKYQPDRKNLKEKFQPNDRKSTRIIAKSMQHKDLLIHQIYQGGPKLTITRIWRNRIALVAVWTAFSNEGWSLTYMVVLPGPVWSGRTGPVNFPGPVSGPTIPEKARSVRSLEITIQLQNSIQNIEKSWRQTRICS